MHGVFHMVLWEHVICGGRTVLGERGIHFGWHQKGRKSYGGKTIFEGVSDHRGHHGKVPLDRRHYNLQLARARVLAPILQDFALAQKKYFNPKYSALDWELVHRTSATTGLDQNPPVELFTAGKN